MKYTRELHEHIRNSADPKHEYTETPTSFLHAILDEIDRLTAELTVEKEKQEGKSFAPGLMNKWLSLKSGKTMAKNIHSLVTAENP